MTHRFEDNAGRLQKMREGKCGMGRMFVEEANSKAQRRVNELNLLRGKVLPQYNHPIATNHINNQHSFHTQVDDGQHSPSRTLSMVAVRPVIAVPSGAYTSTSAKLTALSLSSIQMYRPKFDVGN